ncbi:MAG: hypothetical protein JXQ73_23800 [Phycisphaerae bacterium]|nr:hypothetical protein [Phycisphaerae bacterium]
MPRPRAVLMMIATLLVSGPAMPPSVRAEATNRSPYDQVSRLRHARRQAESELAGLIAERGRATGATAESLDAKINVRVVLHLLYAQATTQAGSALGCLIATRADVLRSGLPLLDALAEQVGAWQADLARLPKGQADAAKRNAFEARLRGIALLTDIAGKGLPKDIGKPEDLAALTDKLAGAIVLMADPDRVKEGMLDLPPAWPAALPADSKSEGHADPEPLDVEQLRASIERSSLSADLRRQMLDVLGQVRAALDVPEHRAEARELGLLLARNLSLAEAITQSPFIAEPSKVALEGKIRTGLLLVSDARTRRLGTERLALAAGVAGILTELRKIRLEEDAHKQIATTLQKAIEYETDELQAGRGLRLLQRLDQVAAGAMMLHRRYEDIEVPRPFDRAADAIRRRWRESIVKAFAALAAEDLATASSETRAMSTCAADMDLTLSLPPAYDLLRQVAPRRSGALRQRLVKAAEAVASGGPDRGPSLAMLRAVLDAKVLVERYQALAYDRQRYAAMDKTLGGRMTTLRKVGDGLARDLVEAFAGGSGSASLQTGAASPDGAWGSSKASYASLERIVSLLAAAYDLARLGELERELSLLERWRAWSPLSDTERGLLDRLSAAVAAMAEQVKGKDVGQGASLSEVQRYGPLPRILAVMAERFGPRLSGAPDGAVGLAARLYQDPHRPATETEASTMRMRHEIGEAGYAGRLGLTDYAGRHLAEAGKLVDAIIKLDR